MTAPSPSVLRSVPLSSSFLRLLRLKSESLSRSFGRRKKIQMATGRLIANAQRQLSDWINNPPATDPKAAKTPRNTYQVQMAATEHNQANTTRKPLQKRHTNTA